MTPGAAVRLPRLGALAVAACLLAGCGSDPERPIVVVGFSADPADPMPGRVMVRPDEGGFRPPVPLGVDGEWITELAANGDHFTAIGLKGGIYRSDPTGTRWTHRRLHRSWLDAVHFPEHLPGFGVLSGNGGVWRTEDGGRNFEKSPAPRTYMEDLAFRTREEGIGVEGFLFPPSGHVWRTENAGRTWDPVAQTPAGLRTAGRPDPEGNEVWTAGDGGTVLVSTDGGLAWVDVSGPRRVEHDLETDFYDIDFAGPDAGWLVGSGGAARAYRGRKFPLSHRWTNGRAGDFVLQGVHAVSPHEAWACGYRSFSDRGVVLRTRNGGRRWEVAAETPGIFWYSIAGRRSP